MRRWLVLLALGWVLVAPSAWGTTLDEGWAGVQEALEAGDAAALKGQGEQLLTLARDLGVRRMTPYSMALLAWAGTTTGPASEEAVKLAARLDPWSPPVAFHLARESWESHDFFHAAAWYVRGWVFSLRSWDRRRQLLAGVLVWVLLALAAAVFIGIVFHTVRFLPELFHDGWELGRLLFSRANAVVFAAVVVLLPVFAGLGPLWLLAWLFALSVSYVEGKKRIMAGMLWLLALSMVPLHEVWMHRMLQPVRAPVEGMAMLLERRAGPSVLQELASLGKALDRSESYHLETGALFWMHGDELSARAHFQKAALASEEDPRPFIFLGNAALADGNPAGAIQLYRKALQRDPGNALAYYNLSRAYDRTYRFEEADQMRRKARKLLGGKDPGLQFDTGTDRLADPPLGWSDLERMRREAGPEGWRAAGLVPPRLDPRELFLHPVPLAFFCTGALGLLLAWARQRWMWTARSCARCGKVFCPRCKTATESDAYCSQCISVFLKRDAVAIEQHAVKVEQIRRREMWEKLGRRLVALAVPGAGEIVMGSWLRGFLTAFLVLLGVTGVALWLPSLVAPVEGELPLLPLQIVLGVMAVLLWIRSIVVSWHGR